MADNSPKRMCTRSTTTIYELVDDVLCETFKHLNDDDLCSVADVCSAFRRNALTQIPLRYAHEYIGFRLTFRAKKFDFRRLMCALRNFGPQIKFLRIILHGATPNCSQKLLEIIIQYCGDTLLGLSLRNIIFPTVLTPKLRTLFSRLQELHVYKCSWESHGVAFEMFSSCHEMLAASFHDTHCFNEERLLPFRGNIPKLKSLTFTECREGEAILKKIFALNPQLEEIVMDLDTPSTIRYIVQCCLQIKKLRFTRDLNSSSDLIENAKLLKRSTNLKSLCIYFANKPFSPVLSELVAAHISLECLHLNCFSSDQALVDGISAMKELKTLELSHGINVKMEDILMIVSNLNELTNLKLIVGSLSKENLLHIVRNAPKLRFFGYERSCTGIAVNDLIPFDERTFKLMLKVVASRGEQFSFVLKLPFGTVDVPKKMLDSYKHLLNIVYY